MTISFKHKEINNGLEMTFKSTMDQTAFKTQFTEIFDLQHYKEGLYKKDMVIVDIGANIGMTAWYFKDYAKQIYSLEPSKDNYDCLVENTKTLPNVKTFNLGISSKSGTEKLFTNGPSNTPESFFGDGSISEDCNFLTLEDFLNQEKIDHVDLLKIDCEGSEYIIFPSSGFKNATNRIEKIIGESHLMRDLVPEFIPEILKDYGFKTRFLPEKNMFKNLSFEDLVTKERKEYRAEFSTLFVAER